MVVKTAALLCGLVCMSCFLQAFLRRNKVSQDDGSLLWQIVLILVGGIFALAMAVCLIYLILEQRPL